MLQRIAKSAIIIFCIFTAGCAPVMTRSNYLDDKTDPLSGDSQIIIRKYEEPPPNSILVGSVKVTDSGFSLNCSEKYILNRLRDEARKIAAEVIILYDMNEPNIFSSCFECSADFYRLKNKEDFAKLQKDNFFAWQSVEGRDKRRSSLESQHILEYLVLIATVFFLVNSGKK